MIRDYRPEDLPQIISIHKSQGFDYSVPDLTSPLVLVKKVREVDGRVVGACFLRITAETFFVVDGGPVEKGRSLIELDPEIVREAYAKGLADIVCVVPPEIAKDFEPALHRFGWVRDRAWPMYSRSLNA